MPKQVVKWGTQYLQVGHPDEKNPPLKVDGILGKDTVTALQEALGVEPDGKLGEDTVTALQELLNSGGYVVPKEIIWTEEFPFEGYQEDGKGGILPLPPYTELTRHPNVEVVWSRMEEYTETRRREEDPQGWVQIGIDIDQVDLKDRMRYDDGVTARTFYTDKLTRHQINEMIRTLKRARNAAYGSDE